jgi:hypothetical protein
MKPKKISREAWAKESSQFGSKPLPPDSPYYNEVSIAFLSTTPRQQRKATSSTPPSTPSATDLPPETEIKQEPPKNELATPVPSGEITFGSFVLPFAVDGSGEELPEDKWEQLEFLQDKVPARCVFLGEINSELDHSPGLTWVTEDYYYLLPWDGPEYDWGLFRISWDDNWGKFGWSPDARIKGITDPKEAARQLFGALMDRWGRDENADYSDFLKSI